MEVKILAIVCLYSISLSKAAVISNHQETNQMIHMSQSVPFPGHQDGTNRQQGFHQQIHVSHTKSESSQNHFFPPIHENPEASDEVNDQSVPEPESVDEPRPQSHVIVISRAEPKPEPKPEPRVIIFAHSAPKPEPKPEPEPEAKLPEKFTLILNTKPDERDSQQQKPRHSSEALSSKESMEHKGGVAFTHENTVYKDTPNFFSKLTVKEEVRVKSRSSQENQAPPPPHVPIYHGNIFLTPPENQPQPTPEPAKVIQIIPLFPAQVHREEHEQQQQQPRYQYYPAPADQQQPQPKPQTQFQPPPIRIEFPRFIDTHQAIGQIPAPPKLQALPPLPMPAMMNQLQFGR